MKSFTTSLKSFALGVVACFGSAFALSAAQYKITVDTSALAGSAAGPFSLYFQLTDGDGVGNGNTTVTLSNFLFGGGAPAGTPSILGDAVGDLSSSITLTDTEPLYNELFQEFSAGSWLSFDFAYSTTAPLGSIADQFTFAILDGSLWNIATDAPGTDALFTFDAETGASVYQALDASLGLSVSASQVPDSSVTGATLVVLVTAVLVHQRTIRRQRVAVR